MKYYHLISLSMMLLSVQYVLQNILQLSLAPWISVLFFMLQLIIFIAYALLLLILLLTSKRQKRTFKKQKEARQVSLNNFHKA